MQSKISYRAFFMRCVGLSSDALRLLKPEKTIGYRIVMAVSPLAHAADYIVSLNKLYQSELLRIGIFDGKLLRTLASGLDCSRRSRH